MQTLALTVNEEMRSRVTCSVVLPRLSPEAIEAFILVAFDHCGLGHNALTADALALIGHSFLTRPLFGSCRCVAWQFTLTVALLSASPAMSSTRGTPRLPY